MATQLLQVNAITKVIRYQGIEKTIPDSYWTSDITPTIYPNWDADKDKLVLFAWYDNNSYICQRRKYVMNFKTNNFEWKDYEMEQVDDGTGEVVFNKFKDTFFLIESLETEEYQNEFAKIHAKTATTSWLTVRLARNFLLSETDHVLLSDAPYTADEIAMYKTYRTKLRDLPAEASSTDPTDLKFPINPKYFVDVFKKKYPSSTYLSSAEQFVTLSAHYGTTFTEKFASYLIVKDITDSLYNKTFMDALNNAGIVHKQSLRSLPEKPATEDFTDDQKEKTKDYLSKMIEEIEKGNI
tara:strand:+ start:1419 stop:2306 length:888 start_codon:yes stop_codon:yes gene_type:complete